MGKQTFLRTAYMRYTDVRYFKHVTYYCSQYFLTSLSSFYKTNKLQTQRLENDTWLTLPASGKAGFWAQEHLMTKLVPASLRTVLLRPKRHLPSHSWSLAFIPGSAWKKGGAKDLRGCSPTTQPEEGKLKSLRNGERRNLAPKGGIAG